MGGQPTDAQRRICQAQNVEPEAPLASDKAGIALETVDQEPLNGLRHRPETGTSGWYIWGGTELSEAPDFFKPLHHHHIDEYCPPALPFLALPPGWRFLLAPGQLDVWFDPALLEDGDARGEE